MATESDVPPGGPLDDAAAIARVLRGDTAAFAAVVARHGARLLRLAFSILRDRGLAEDAVQDAFVKAYTHLSSFRGRARFSTWLHRIAIREALQRRRARGRRRETPVGSLEAPERAAFEHRPNPGPSPGAPVEIADLLARLPENQRAAVLLRDVEGLSYAEIGALLRASPGTVASWIHRGRGRLRREWKG